MLGPWRSCRQTFISCRDCTGLADIGPRRSGNGAVVLCLISCRYLSSWMQQLAKPSFSWIFFSLRHGCFRRRSLCFNQIPVPPLLSSSFGWLLSDCFWWILCTSSVSGGFRRIPFWNCLNGTSIFLCIITIDWIYVVDPWKMGRLRASQMRTFSLFFLSLIQTQ